MSRVILRVRTWSFTWRGLELEPDVLAVEVTFQKDHRFSSEDFKMSSKQFLSVIGVLIAKTVSVEIACLSLMSIMRF